jgi:1-acyl-sn-glycerol-3-phosphate acyltransferase
MMKHRALVYSATRGVARLFFPLFYRIETKKEATLPVTGPLVILPKHQYWTDIPLVSLSFDLPLYFVAKNELFRYPWIRTYLKLLGGLPVDREQSVRTLDSIRHLLALLKAGERIVLFPEGTYFREVVGSGKSRLIQLILRFQSELKQTIPFIPIGIRYGERVGWRRRVRIQVGHPLYAETELEAVAFTDRVMGEICRLSGLPAVGRE